MQAINITGSVTRFMGSPVGVRALLQSTENGEIAVSIVDSVLNWEVPVASATALAPFFKAMERRLDVDRATDPNKTILNFNYIADDGGEKTVSVAMTRGQLVKVG